MVQVADQEDVVGAGWTGRFEDRKDAGRRLAESLGHLREGRPVVLGLPRGGVPVATVVAQSLRAPLDVLVVRKLGVPFHPELAFGAVAEGGARVVDEGVVAGLHLSAASVAEVEERERAELDRRVARWRVGRPAVPLWGRTVVVVDDGLATGATARVACRLARERGAAHVVLAVPVGAPDRLAAIRDDHDADEVVAVLAPRGFRAVGEHYVRFDQVSDAWVSHLLDVATPLNDIREAARPLRSATDLGDLVDALSQRRLVCLGEASHGTREFYEWRAEVTRRLVEVGDRAFIAVEGDWPDCWRLDAWVRGRAGRDLDAAAALGHVDRWPTWMWANREVADFLDWLRAFNDERDPDRRVGFYGLDVYSLWESLREVREWVRVHSPDALASVERAWRCFLPFGEDPHRYASRTRLVPRSCEADVVALLVAVRAAARAEAGDDAAFDAVQNAEVAARAEEYYRTMVRGGRASWNLRDRHMADTVERLAAHLGPGAAGIVWAHNTHVGDARGTDMAGAGMLNLGQLLRERHGPDEVALVGFAGHRGRVLAGSAWGGPEQVMAVPPARVGSHEDLLHEALGEPAVLVFDEDRSTPWLSGWAGHRAVGVVYDPRHEAGTYVPTRMGARYDALLSFEDTRPVRPLHHEGRPLEAEYETEPTGY